MDKNFCIYKTKQVYYARSLTEKPNPEFHNPHIHIQKEIYIFLKGNVEYVIEGTVYKPEPNDILIINDGEQHYVRFLGTEDYERIVINIRPEFFNQKEMRYIQDFFDEIKTKKDYLIPGYSSHNESIPEVLMRLEKYANNEQTDLPVTCALLEFLHLLTKAKRSNLAHRGNKIVAETISYINNNLQNPISLDDLAKNCYISKYYLCKLFKEYTGFTLNNYIINKRILKVRELCQQGMSITEAVSLSGFSNYSNFYRAYTVYRGHSPKDDLKTGKKTKNFRK